MPWTLYYPIPTPGEDEEFHQEYDLLASHPDVARVRFIEPDPSGVVATRLEVWFEDELFRTEDPVLHHIRSLRQPAPPKTDTELKQHILDQYLNTIGLDRDPSGSAGRDGRLRLAASMIAPIRRQLDYSSIARRTFLVEQLPEGALPIYDRDLGVAQMVMPDPPVLDQGQTGDSFSHGIQSLTASFERAEELARQALNSPVVTIDDLFTTPAPRPPSLYEHVEGYNPEAPIQSGTSATITLIDAAGLVQIRGLHGMGPTSVGHYLELQSSPHPGNNGRFLIVREDGPTGVWIQNPAASFDGVYGHTWSEYFGPLGEMFGGVSSVEHHPIDLSWVENPTDPQSRLTLPIPPEWVRSGRLTEKMTVENPNKSNERRSAWGRLLSDDVLEND